MADPFLVSLLRQGKTKEFNERKKAAGSKILDLEGANLANLKNGELSKADLRGSLVCANGADFSESNISEMLFDENTRLAEADFHGCQMTEAQWMLIGKSAKGIRFMPASKSP